MNEVKDKLNSGEYKKQTYTDRGSSVWNDFAEILTEDGEKVGHLCEGCGYRHHKQIRRLRLRDSRV